jgi:hypothetical protein
MGEHRAEHVKVHGDRKVPAVDNAGVHVEVDDHAHHLFLESTEPFPSAILDPLARFLVGGDIVEDSARITVPEILDCYEVLLPEACDLVGVKAESDDAEK